MAKNETERVDSVNNITEILRLDFVKYEINCPIENNETKTLFKNIVF